MTAENEMLERTANCLAKLDRMNKTLRHEEADRVPVSDFFWGSFVERWKKDLGLPEETDIYTYYDLDWIVTVPNMDPHIKDFEVLRENEQEVVVRTGFEAVLRKKFADPMPNSLDLRPTASKRSTPLNLMTPGMTGAISAAETTRLPVLATVMPATRLPGSTRSNPCILIFPSMAVSVRPMRI